MINEYERDLKLIERQEKYEEEFYSRIVDDMLKDEALDELIEKRFEYIEDSFDFEPSPEMERLGELESAEWDMRFKNHSRGIDDCDDYIDYVDYPDGSDENLGAADYGEPSCEFEEIPDEFYDRFVDDALNEFPSEDDYYERLIEQHIREEEDFLDHALERVIEEEEYFKKAVDEMIFEDNNLDYDPKLFDYGDSQLGEAESVFRNYVERNGKLDDVIKKKIRQKKFSND